MEAFMPTHFLVPLIVVLLVALTVVLLIPAATPQQRAAKKKLRDANWSASEARRAISYTKLTGYPFDCRQAWPSFARL